MYVVAIFTYYCKLEYVYVSLRHLFIYRNIYTYVFIPGGKKNLILASMNNFNNIHIITKSRIVLERLDIYRVQKYDCHPLHSITGNSCGKISVVTWKPYVIRFIWDKKYDFSVFGFYLTDVFAMVILFVKLAKN